MPAVDNQNPPALPKRFVSGEFMSIKSADDENSMLHLVYKLWGEESVYDDNNNEEKLLPELAALINNGVDFRSILLAMVSFDNSKVALSFIDYLSRNKITLPIEKEHSEILNDTSSNFFSTIAAFGNIAVTESLFRHAVDGYRAQLKATSHDLSDSEIKEKIHLFVEKILAIKPFAGKCSALEYVITSISPALLYNEGLFYDEESLAIVSDLAFELNTEATSKEVKVEYNLPWKTIKAIVESALAYGVNLKSSRFATVFVDKNIFDILGKFTSSENFIKELFKKINLPYQSSSKRNSTDVKIVHEGDANRVSRASFSLDLEPMHYSSSNTSSRVNFRMSTELMDDELKAINDIILAGANSNIVDLERLRRHSMALKAHSGDIAEHAETLKVHSSEIKEIKVDIQDLKKGAAQLEEIIKTHLADELILKDIGDSEFLKRFYIEIRDEILVKLKKALDGNPDKQFELLCNNARAVGGALDFAASFAGVPGVIGASVGVLVYVSKYFEHARQQNVSKEMKKILIGSVNLPSLIAIGIAEKLVKRLKANPMHESLVNKDEQDKVISMIKAPIKEQLSGSELNKLFKLNIVEDNQTDAVESLKDILFASAINSKPVTSSHLGTARHSVTKGLLKHVKVTGFSSAHKLVYSKEDSEFFRKLFNPAKNPNLVDNESKRSHSDSSSASSDIRSGSDLSPLI